MRLRRLLVLAVLLVPLWAASPPPAAGFSFGGFPSLGGDDLTVCCQAVFRKAAMTAARLFVPQVTGCTAIGSDSVSINSCPGVVLGCAEGAFICEPPGEPSANPGTKDCACVLFLQGAPY